MSVTSSFCSTCLRKFEKFLLRTGIRRHYIRLSTLNVNLFVSDREIDNVLDSKSLFFILNSGRCGSSLMAELLNKSTNAVVFHEPVPLENFGHLEAIHNSEAARQYIQNFRRKYTYLLIRHRTEPIYGETNGHLRRHVEYIHQQWPSAKLIHLVRNPKKVIPSVMNRDTLLDSHPLHKPSVLMSSKLTQAEWDEMSRFEKVCHVWQEENAFIRDKVSDFVRLEDIVTNYAYFKTNILDVLDLYVSEEVWSKMVSKPINISVKNKFPQFENWSKVEVATFERICSKEMSEYGYSIAEN